MRSHFTTPTHTGAVFQEQQMAPVCGSWRSENTWSLWLVQYPQTDQKKHARPTSPSRALIYTGKPKRSIGLALGSHYLYFIHQDSTQEGFRSLEVGFGGRFRHIQSLTDLREA